MQRLGYQRAVAEGVYDYLLRIAAQNPPLADELEQCAALYRELAFAKICSVEATTRFMEKLASLLMRVGTCAGDANQLSQPIRQTLFP